MAEHRPEMTVQVPTAARWRSRAIAVVAAIALLGAHGFGGPPSPPVVPPGRTRLARIRILGRHAAAVPTRLRRWLRLALVPRAIARAPMCRTDTPALPTVGRPRDGPRHLAGGRSGRERRVGQRADAVGFVNS